MQKNRSKRYRAAAEQLDRNKAYNLPEAVSTLKKFSPPKFDQTVTMSFRLGVDPKQSDQMVRGTCPLPHGSGKKVRVLVFAEGDAARAAKEAGAEYVGFKDMIAKAQEGFQDFDVAIATPAAMAEVRKLGKVLGPRGLMPNPKTGTVTDDTATAVREVKAGRVEFKLDKNGNVAVPVGKFSFAEDQLVQNGTAVIEAVVRARPATAKGRFVDGLTLSATMSPGITVDPSPYLTFRKSMRPEKANIVSDLSEKLSRSSFTLVTDYQRMKVDQFSELRNRLAPAGAELRVVKNSFLKRALAESGMPDVEKQLSGQTAVVTGEKDVAPVAKILKAFAAEFKIATLKVGLVDKSILSTAEVEALAELPSREVLLAKLLGLLLAPATQLVRVLNEPASAFARLLKAKGEKGGGDAIVAESTPGPEAAKTSEPAAAEALENAAPVEAAPAESSEPPAGEPAA